MQLICTLAFSHRKFWKLSVSSIVFNTFLIVYNTSLMYFIRLKKIQLMKKHILKLIRIKFNTLSTKLNTSTYIISLDFSLVQKLFFPSYTVIMMKNYTFLKNDNKEVHNVWKFSLTSKKG